MAAVTEKSRNVSVGKVMLALALALSVQSILQTPAAAAPAEWSQLPALPDRVGFAGMFAGVSGGALIAAGGANFPHQPLAEGGAKVWHDSVLVLEDPQGPWRQIEHKLPGRWPTALRSPENGNLISNQHA